MKLSRSALVYTAVGLGAIALLVGVFQSTGDSSSRSVGTSALTLEQIQRLEEMREGQIRKLTFHSEPRSGSGTTFTDPAGNTLSLADYEGKYVLVNFWATWCAPCLKEMPSLDRLQAELGGEMFEVVPVATSRNSKAAIDRFWRETGIENLPVLLDPQSALAADFGAMSLPVTIILNPAGQEIARLVGEAEWDSESAVAIIKALMEGSAPAA